MDFVAPAVSIPSALISGTLRGAQVGSAATTRKDNNIAIPQSHASCRLHLNHGGPGRIAASQPVSHFYYT